jgi:type 1 glutamine amidotransferase
MSRVTVIAAIAMALSLSFTAAAEGPKVLFLSTSEAFAHAPIVQRDGKPSVADKTLEKLVEDMGGTFTTTKDCSVINAANLEKYDLVVFCTQGDLTKPNKVGAPPMGANGVAELIDWIKSGGAFIGFHSATDTFRSGTDEPTPYTQMIGAEFRGHGKQFVGTIKVVDPEHPTMANVPDGWEHHDEWYLFRNFNTETMHVLALMDPGEERSKQEMYDIPPYPVIWCSTLGDGRVYFSALGHGNVTWLKSEFQQTIVDAINWTLADGDAQAAPNYDEVVPKE